MNIFSKPILLVCLFFFVMTPFVLAKKTKLNLKLFDTPTDFSSEVSSASSIMGTRRKPDEPCVKMVMPAPSNPSGPLKPVAIPLTPDLAKVYAVAPIFEWKTPVCSKENKCFVDISTEEMTLVDHMPLEDNTYEFKDELLSGTTYFFNLTNESDKGPVNLKLKFYTLDDKQKKQFAKELAEIKAEDDYIEKVSELELFYKKAIWFDVVSLLNELITENPEDQSLIEFKEKLYQTVQK